MRDLDLVVRRGEVLALLGANGAGKTTTLLALAGELRPLAGDVRWDGRAIGQPLYRRAATGTALVPEERSAVRSLTVADNLRLGGCRGRARAGALPRARATARPQRRAHLGRRAADAHAGRALGRQPQLLLADEVSLGLAPLVVERLLTALRAAADDGVAVVVVEQQARRALDIADHVVVLRRGRVELGGPAAELRDEFGRIEAAYLSGVQE